MEDFNISFNLHGERATFEEWDAAHGQSQEFYVCKSRGSIMPSNKLQKSVFPSVLHMQKLSICTPGAGHSGSLTPVEYGTVMGQ